MTIPENVFIKNAKYVGDYRIAFRFTDGHVTEVDFHLFLTRAGQNPMVTQFLNMTRFKDFTVDGRSDIVWGDWEMCFPFAALYAGDLAVDSLGKRSKPMKPTQARLKLAVSRRKRGVVADSKRQVVKVPKKA
ncbi:MAG: DUF2442 domain-containing protein [Flavobacteriales bacterium]